MLVLRARLTRLGQQQQRYMILWGVPFKPLTVAAVQFPRVMFRTTSCELQAQLQVANILNASSSNTMPLVDCLVFARSRMPMVVVFADKRRNRPDFGPNTPTTRWAI